MTSPLSASRCDPRPLGARCLQEPLATQLPVSQGEVVNEGLGVQIARQGSAGEVCLFIQPSLDEPSLGALLPSDPVGPFDLEDVGWPVPEQS